MKTIKTIIWALLVTIAVSGSVFAQSVSTTFFQNKMAKAVIYSPTLNAEGKTVGGIKLQAILDDLAAAHGFTYILENSTNGKFLTEKEIAGKFPDQPLDERLNRMFAKINEQMNPPVTIRFNKNVLLINRVIGVTTTASATPVAPSTTTPANPTRRQPVYGRNNSDVEDRLENPSPVIQRESIDPRDYDYTQVQPQRVMNQQPFQPVYVAAPQMPSDWNSDFYTYPIHRKEVGLVGYQVGARDQWYGYNNGIGVRAGAGVLIGGYNNWPNQQMYNPSFAMREWRQFQNESFTAAFMLKGDDIQLKDVEVWVNGQYKNTGNRVNNPRWDGTVKVDPGVPSVVTIRHTNLNGHDACFTRPITPDSMADSLVASFNKTFFLEITVNPGKFYFPIPKESPKNTPLRLRGTFDQNTNTCTLATS